MGLIHPSSFFCQGADCAEIKHATSGRDTTAIGPPGTDAQDVHPSRIPRKSRQDDPPPANQETGGRDGFAPAQTGMDVALDDAPAGERAVAVHDPPTAHIEAFGLNGKKRTPGGKTAVVVAGNDRG